MANDQDWHVPHGRWSQGSAPSVVSAIADTRPRLLKQTTAFDGSSNQPVEEEMPLKLECDVCYNFYSDKGDYIPRSLSCGHTFCSGCLNRMIRVANISCPKCHHITSVPPNGVSGLVKNFSLLELIYCQPQTGYVMSCPDMNLLSSAPTQSSVMSEAPVITRGTARSPQHLSNAPFCEEHGDHLTSYCEEDNVLVCSSCMVYGRHKNHSCKPVMELSQEYRRTLLKISPLVAQQVCSLEGGLEEFTSLIKDINETSEKLSSDIDSHFDVLVAILDRRRKKLKLDVLYRSQSRVESLMQQAKATKEHLERGKHCMSVCDTISQADPYTLLSGYHEVQEEVDRLFKTSPSTAPVARNDLAVQYPPSIVEELTEQFDNYGTVKSEVGVVQHLRCVPYHDGVKIYWDKYNYTDSIGMNYTLQVCKNESLPPQEIESPSDEPQPEVFVNIYKGGDSKYCWKYSFADDEVCKFRVRVQTNQGASKWSDTVSCKKGKPLWRWNRKWCNVRITHSQMEVSSTHSSSGKWMSVASDAVLEMGRHYMEIMIVDIPKPNLLQKSLNTKLAFGLIQYTALVGDMVDWQSGKKPIGQLSVTSSSLSNQTYHSWSFLATSGKLLSSQVHGEKDYTHPIELEKDDRIGMLVEMDSKGTSVSYFCNGRDLGMAFDNIKSPVLPVLSICDKFHVKLSFPPPPYEQRNPQLKPKVVLF